MPLVMNQALIDRETYEPKLGPFADATACIVCDGTPVTHLHSPWTGQPVGCVEIANGFGLKMGWAFFRYLPPNVVEVPELFVWPTFRRMGVGRMLEDLATVYARLWECSEIRLMMNEADAVTGPPRAAARLFAQAHGYRWQWRQEIAPRHPATAYKTL